MTTAELEINCPSPDLLPTALPSISRSLLKSHSWAQIPWENEELLVYLNQKPDQDMGNLTVHGEPLPMGSVCEQRLVEATLLHHMW